SREPASAWVAATDGARETCRAVRGGLSASAGRRRAVVSRAESGWSSATTAPGNDGKTAAPPPGKVELRVVESCPRRWLSGGDGCLVAMTRLGPRGSPNRGTRPHRGVWRAVGDAGVGSGLKSGPPAAAVCRQAGQFHVERVAPAAGA